MKLQNQLVNSVNPYLRAHASNPIAWNLWSKKTLDLAKTTDKPIFLSIGYHSCHWCHVMNRESFMNKTIADRLNSDFIPVKIDKEEYPDLDSIYMMYLQATTGSGGWPLNVFLTPNLAPIFGGTYWAGPDVPQDKLSTLNAVPFANVLQAVHTQWTENRSMCQDNAEDISAKLKALVDGKTAEPVSLDNVFADADSMLNSTADAGTGGWGQAPKFPLPATLGYAINSQDSNVRQHALHTLSAIANGGIKDQVGNGISRYSVTADWHLPHFEKMLCDQALMLAVSLEDPSQAEFAHDLTDFLVSGPLRSSEGGWFSAVDADSENEHYQLQEGAYYTWTSGEMSEALASLKLFDRDMVMDYYGANEHGNVNADLDPHGEFRGKNILSKYRTPEQVASSFGRTVENTSKILAAGRKLLLQWREKNRKPPALDTKVVTGWNGAAIGALAKAFYTLDRQDALDAAIKGAAYLRSNNWDGQQLFRTTNMTTPAVNDDYAYLIGGLVELYQATFDTAHLVWALELQQIQLKKFWDRTGGGFYTSQDLPWLLFRPKATFDSAEPSSNGTSLRNLVALGQITGNSEFVQKSKQLVDAFSADIAAQPTGYLSMLPSIDRPFKCVAIIGNEAQALAKLEEARGLALVERAPVVRVTTESIHLFPYCTGLDPQQDARVEIIEVA